MVKRNIYLRAAVLLFIACMALTCVFAGSTTFAKYVALTEGDAVARVARFSVKVVGLNRNAQPDNYASTAAGDFNDARAFELAKAAGADAGIAFSRAAICTEVTATGANPTHLATGCRVGEPCKFGNTSAANATLFYDIFDSEYQSSPLSGSYDGVSVKAASPNVDDRLVAPGTTKNSSGINLVKIWNESEVAVRVKAEIIGSTNIGDGGGTEVPIQLKKNGTWAKANNSTFATPYLIGTFDLPPNQTGLGAVAGPTTFSYIRGIEWRWVFDGATTHDGILGETLYTSGRHNTNLQSGDTRTQIDYYDTRLGMLARGGPIEAGFTIRITVTQID